MKTPFNSVASLEQSLVYLFISRNNASGENYHTNCKNYHSAIYVLICYQ